MTIPPQGPPPGQNPMEGWPPSRRVRPAISVGFVFLGVFVYFFLNFVLGFIGLMNSGSSSSESNIGFAVVAVALVVISFGGGGAMLASYNGSYRGFGLGLMIGWALTSLFTVGICTGLNPSVYSL